MGRLNQDSPFELHFSLYRSEIVLLDVVNNERESFILLTVLNDGDGGSALHLAGSVFFVVLAVTKPFSHIVAVLNVDDGDASVLGEGFDELLVLLVVAVLGEDAELGLLTIEGFANLVETLNKLYKQNKKLQSVVRFESLTGPKGSKRF